MENVDTRIAPALHPENIRAIKGYGEDTADAAAPALRAFQAAYEGLRAIHNARDQAKSNPTWNEAQQILSTDDYAWKQMERITKTFDGAAATLAKDIADLDRELSEPVKEKAGDPISREIREHVKALEPTERLTFLHEAIESGDEATVSAVLGTVPYLSGLTVDNQALYTRMYRERMAPARAKRLAVMQTAKGLMDAKGSMLLGEVAKAIGANPAKVKALRAAKTKAEEAFILRDA